MEKEYTLLQSTAMTKKLIAFDGKMKLHYTANWTSPLHREIWNDSQGDYLYCNTQVFVAFEFVLDLGVSTVCVLCSEIAAFISH